MVDFREVTTLPVAVRPGPTGRSAVRPHPGHPVGDEVSRSGTLGMFLARSWRSVADPAGRDDRSARRVAEFRLGRAWLVAVLCGLFGLGLVLVALMVADVRSPSAPVVSVADRPQLTAPAPPALGTAPPPALGTPAPRPTPAAQQRDTAATQPPASAEPSAESSDSDSGSDKPDGDSHSDREDQPGWQQAQDWARLGANGFMPHRESADAGAPYPGGSYPGAPYPGRPYPGGAFVGAPAPGGATPSSGAYPGDANRSRSDGRTWHNYPTR